jgi:AcrR family transcriptional regulator
MEKDLNTEQRILQAAQRVFYRAGLGGARMEEIAREAGINKALLHYYFRSKDKLFERIFVEAFHAFLPQAAALIAGPLPLAEKITRISHFYVDLLKDKPFLPVFVLNAMQADPEGTVQRLFAGAPVQPSHILREVLRQIQQEFEGREKKPDPRHLFVNVLSLSVFPFAARPILRQFLGMDDDAFLAFIETRRQIVPQVILAWLRSEYGLSSPESPSSELPT